METKQSPLSDSRERKRPFYSKLRIKPWHAAFYEIPSKKNLLVPLKLNCRDGRSDIVTSGSAPKIRTYAERTPLSQDKIPHRNTMKMLDSIYLKINSRFKLKFKERKVASVIRK